MGMASLAPLPPPPPAPPPPGHVNYATLMVNLHWAQFYTAVLLGHAMGTSYSPQIEFQGYTVCLLSCDWFRYKDWNGATHVMRCGRRWGLLGMCITSAFTHQLFCLNSVLMCLEWTVQ